MHICQTESGPVGTGTWEVDGASSTGILAGAGSGDVTIRHHSPHGDARESNLPRVR